MIQVTDLSRNYGRFRAIDHINFKINKGEVVGLLGHNGAGKTTIMRMLTGFLEPSTGSVKVDSLEINCHKQQIQKKIGYLPENCPVWPEMTVIDYLYYQAQLHGVTEDAIDAAVVDAIRKTDLKQKASASIQTLSRGYRQRVGVAQAILHKPAIIILDEPTNGLDPTQILHMRTLIRELAQDATIILSTHILQEVQAVCERVLIMRNGELVIDSKIDALQNSQSIEVTLDQAKAEAYLSAINGVEKVVKSASTGDHFIYELTAAAEIAPDIAQAVHNSGDQLFSLKPITRNLETVFAEVNATSPSAT
ncbi:MAG: ABC transporter ATP-binding protein [Opitutales bacterium]